MKIEFINHKSCILFVFIVACLLSPRISLSESDLPDDNLAYPVLLISKEGGTGSGFFYNKDEAIYLITARHVLFNETSIRVPEAVIVPKNLRCKLYCIEDKGKKDKKEFILTFYGVMLESEKNELIKATPKTDNFNFIPVIERLYKESQKLKLRSTELTLFSYDRKVNKGGINEFEVQLMDLYNNGQIKYHPTHDVAFIRIGIPKKVKGEDIMKLQKGVIKKQGTGVGGLSKDNFKLFKDVIVGNQVFVFGYPTSISGINPWLDTKLPLLRKGTIAGKNENLNAIILDCPAFQGNSGGLVIEVEQESIDKIKYKAIGLITNLVPYAGAWIQNSGYSIVVPMDFVEELLNAQSK
ncbi:MAG: hypothetical protein ABSA71_00665 [Desulfomonilia bacterium]|jgi:hypothetical protein